MVTHRDFDTAIDLDGSDDDSLSSKLVATCFCRRYELNFFSVVFILLLLLFFHLRKPSYYIFNAYFCIFLITGSCLCIFSISSSTANSRLGPNFSSLLTSISFKWIINKYLPPVSYLTNLDIYSLIHIIFLCSLSVWHAILGVEPSTRPYDFALFITFCSLFATIQVGFFVWFLNAFRRIRKLRKEETAFIEKIKMSGSKAK